MLSTAAACFSLLFLSSSPSFLPRAWAAPSHPSMQAFPLHASSDSHFIDHLAIHQIENPLWRHEQLQQQSVEDEAAGAENVNMQSRDHARLRSRFNLTPQAVSVAPLTGCSSVDFSAGVTLGGQGPFKLIVDTGSTTLAVASSACTTCTGVTPLYTENPNNLVGTANTVQSLYGAGNVGWQGSAYTETVSLGTPSATASVVIAGINTQMAFFSASGCNAATANGNTNQGIMGFAYPALAVAPTQSFFTNWQAQTGGANVFAIQMCRNSGTLWVGGVDTAAFTGAIYWTSIVRQLYYNLNIMDVATAPAATPATFTSLGISAAVYNAGFAIADSGTTLMLLPTSAYSQLIKTLQADANFVAAFGANFFTSGNCLAASQTPATLNAKLPLLRITLGDANNANPLFLTMSAVNSYLRVVQSTANNANFYCPGVSPLTQGTILGWSVLNQFVTVHDITNSLIGFAPSTTCISSTATDAFQSPAGQVSGGVANPNFPASGVTASPTAAAATTNAVPTKAATTKAAVPTKAATTKAAVPTKAATTKAAATKAATTKAPTTKATKKRISLLQWIINQIWMENDAWQANMAAGDNAVLSFTYTAANDATDDSVNVMAWLASPKSLPIYLSSSIPASGGSGTWTWSVPTDGSVPNGAYSLMVGTTASTATAGPAVVVADSATNLCTTSLCSFNGLCSNSACNCYAGWTGANCEIASSSSTTSSSSINLMDTSSSSVSCVNGVVSNGACYCNANYAGVDCSLMSLPASLTFAYSMNQVNSQLGLFGSLLATDLFQAAGLPDASYITFSNIVSNVAMATQMSTQAVTVTFNLQCSTTSDSFCSTDYLNAAYQALAAQVADPTSDYSLSVSGQNNVQDLALVTPASPATTSSTFFTTPVIIGIAAGGVAVIILAVVAVICIRRRKQANAATSNVSMTKQQTTV